MRRAGRCGKFGVLTQIDNEKHAVLIAIINILKHGKEGFLLSISWSLSLGPHSPLYDICVSAKEQFFGNSK